MAPSCPVWKRRTLEQGPEDVDTIPMPIQREPDSSVGVVPLADDNLADFLSYCSIHGPGHDDSFLPGPGFLPDPDHPSFVLRTGGELRGAASLLLGPAFRAARRSRFAILHAAAGDREDYRALLRAAALAAAPSADELYLFLPEGLSPPSEYLAEAGFELERISYSMSRENLDQEPGTPPPGYRLVSLESGDEDGARSYADIRNRNFRELTGSRPLRIEDVLADMGSPGIPPGGICVLRAPDGSACGTLRVERDVEQDCLSVGALTVDREHRGKGLGRYLLRAAAALGRRECFRRASLSVNASNGNALSLYESEGYTVQAALACLAGRIPDILEHLASESNPV